MRAQHNTFKWKVKTYTLRLANQKRKKTTATYTCTMNSIRGDYVHTLTILPNVMNKL